MPSLRLAPFALVLSVVLAAPLFAQGATSCRPADSAAVARWHATWDTVALGTFHDRPGNMVSEFRYELPRTWVPIHREAVYGRWSITARLARLRQSDTGWTGELRLEVPSDSVVEDFGNDAWVKPDRVLQGWLIGRSLVEQFAGPGRDSVSIVAYFTPEGRLEIAEDFGVADGGWFSSESIDDGRIGGYWSPPGAVIPEFMGWFCTDRLWSRADSSAWVPVIVRAFEEYLFGDRTARRPTFALQAPDSASAWLQGVLAAVEHGVDSARPSWHRDEGRTILIWQGSAGIPGRTRATVAIEFDDWRCPAAPGSSGGFVGGPTVEIVVVPYQGEGRERWEAHAREGGNFDGECAAVPRGRRHRSP